MRLLTILQKEQLLGQLFDGVQRFNPVQDINGDWFISKEEVSQTTVEEFNWIADLPIAEYIPKLPPNNE